LGWCGWLALAGVVLAASLGPAGACRAAGLVISAPELTVTRGSSGSFDVLLTNTSTTTSFDVSSDVFQLGLSGPVDASFTAVSIATSAQYIYVTSSTTVAGGSPLSVDTFPNMMFTASDSEFASPGFRVVMPGQTFGLANVSYSVSATSPAGFDALTFLNVSLTDINGNDIPVAMSNGSIGIIPEPSTLIQATTAVLFGVGVGWWRKRRQRAGVGAPASSAPPT
jgi:hypothetical protein